MLARIALLLTTATVVSSGRMVSLDDDELCPAFKSKSAQEACGSYQASLTGAVRAYWDIVASRQRSYADALNAALKEPLVADDPQEVATIQAVVAALGAQLDERSEVAALPFAPPKEPPTQVNWHYGDPAKKLMRAAEGICFLSGIGGNLEGGGEAISIVIRDGWWVLEGKSAQESLWATATCVRFKR
jgi:hypothetical protein